MLKQWLRKLIVLFVTFAVGVGGSSLLLAHRQAALAQHYIREQIDGEYVLSFLGIVQTRYIGRHVGSNYQLEITNGPYKPWIPIVFALLLVCIVLLLTFVVNYSRKRKTLPTVGQEEK